MERIKNVFKLANSMEITFVDGNNFEKEEKWVLLVKPHSTDLSRNKQPFPSRSKFNFSVIDESQLKA